MRGKIVLASLILSLSAVAASAQSPAASAPIYKDVYCSGTITNESVPQDSYVITGEGSNYRLPSRTATTCTLTKAPARV